MRAKPQHRLDPTPAAGPRQTLWRFSVCFRITSLLVLSIALGRSAFADELSPPQAPEPPQPAPAPTHWLAGAGLGLRGLRFVLDGSDPGYVDYKTNILVSQSLTAGYDDFVLSASFPAGNLKPEETHGRSRGFDLVAAYPISVMDRELMLVATVQNYLGLYRDPQPYGPSDRLLLPRDGMRSYFYGAAGTYYLNPAFSSSQHAGHPLTSEGSLAVGLSLSHFGVSDQAPLIPTELSENYGGLAKLRSLNATTLAAPVGGELYLVAPFGGYVSLGAGLGPNVSYVSAKGSGERGVKVGATASLSAGYGFTSERFFIGCLLDAQVNALMLSEATAYALSMVGFCELGFMF